MSMPRGAIPRTDSPRLKGRSAVDAAPDRFGRLHHQVELALLIVHGDLVAFLGGGEAALRGDA
jgi:hypothetical protein